MRYRILSTALAMFVLMGSAYATITFLPGNPGGSFQNVNGTGGGMGMLITGFPANAPTIVVQFSSTMDLVGGSGAGGSITTPTGLIHNVTITVPGHGFSDLVIDPFKEAVLGDLTVIATASNGAIFDFHYGSAQDVMGNNFLSIVALNGELIKSVTIDSVNGFTSLDHTRFLADEPFPDITVIPEPGTLGLVGTGLIGLAGMARRKLKV